jgi:sec-independent protein translocase protein TatB
VFNVTGGELVIILLVALIVLGPDKLPDAIRKVGRVYGELRRMSTGFQSEIREALDEPMREVRDTMNTMKGGFMGGDDPPPGTRMTAPSNGGPSTDGSTDGAPATAEPATPEPATPEPAAAAPTLDELAAAPAEAPPTNGSAAPSESPATESPATEWPATESPAIESPAAAPADNEHP